MKTSERHAQQKHKNYVLFGLLIGLVALLFALTVVKMAG